MAADDISQGEAKRSWFRRLAPWKRVVTLLAIVVCVVVALAVVGGVLSRSREAPSAAARFSLPASFVQGTGALTSVPPVLARKVSTEEAARPAAAVPPSPGAPMTALPSLETWDRQLILSAMLGLEVRDVRAAYERIQMVAAGEGALIAAASLQATAGSASAERTAGYAHATVVLRMPQSRFHAVRRRLAELAPDLGAKLLRDEVTSEDVTEEYVDLQARLRSWRSQETQLLGIMGQARLIPDILAVRNEVASVQQEIERLSGRLRFLQNRVDLSSITVEVYQKGKGPVRPTIVSTWKGAGREIAAAAVQSLKNVVYALGQVVAALVYLLPFAVIGSILWIAIRATRKRAAPTLPRRC